MKIERLVSFTFDPPGVGHPSRDLDMSRSRDSQHKYWSPRGLPIYNMLGFKVSDCERHGARGHTGRGTSDPHVRQTNACCRRMETTGDIVEWVVKILKFMEELHQFLVQY